MECAVSTACAKQVQHHCMLGESLTCPFLTRVIVVEADMTLWGKQNKDELAKYMI